MAEGYVYTSSCDTGPIAKATVGARVSLPVKKPPWIVVNHSIEHVLIGSGWPGALWRVRIVDCEGIEQGGPYATYTRAAVVDVLEQLPVSSLFGPCGAAVCRVIDVADKLTVDTALALASAKHVDASARYNAVFFRWFRTWREGHAEGTHGSPINGGVSVLSYVLRRRAIELAGQAALIYYEEDGEEELAPPWSTAFGPLANAALAFGAPHLCHGDERDILLQAWNAVIPNETEPSDGQ